MSVAKETMPLPSKGADESPPLIGIVLIAGGLLLLGWLGWALISPGGGETPYYYEKVAEGGVKEFPELGLEAYKGITIRKYGLIAEEVRKGPLVKFYTGSRKGRSPVLLKWNNSFSEPVLRLGGSIEGLPDLAQAVVERIPAEAVVLAWWDTSRRLGLLTGVNTLFDENLAQPLLIPPPWSEQREAIEALEREFWQVSNSGETQARLDRLVEALLADPAAGASMLRKLVGDQEAYVVIHRTDPYMLSALVPKRFGMSFKNFPGRGQLHALIPRVKGWMEEEGHESYLLDRTDDDTVRAYYLLDEADQDTLLAEMLPFSTSNPRRLEALQLRSRYGGYWVYSLPPAGKAG